MTGKALSVDQLTVFECRVSKEALIEFVELDGTVRAAMRASFVERDYIPALEKCMKLKLKKFDYTVKVGKDALRVVLAKQYVGPHHRMMKRGVKIAKEIIEAVKKQQAEEDGQEEE